MMIITAKQFESVKDITSYMELANAIRDGLVSCKKNKTMATLFYEPSTRTRLSFEAAMYKLGGNVISTENASQFSSAVKGESLEDTIRVVSGYCDVIVLRHPSRGSAEIASKCSQVPVINAGDGDGEHPTQALLDIYTIYRRKKTIANLHYALVGDLKYGRTIHSLIYLLSLYDNIQITLVSPKELSLPDELLDYINSKNISYIVTDHLQDAIVYGQPDVVYMTRVQEERFDEKANGNIFGEEYKFHHEFLEQLPKDSIIMHPLPRRNELPKEIDKDNRAVYFEQSANGLWIRAAILHKLIR